MKLKDDRFIGALLLICGSMLLGAVHIGIAVYTTKVSAGFTFAVSAIYAWFPYILGIAFLITGGFMLIQYFMKMAEVRLKENSNE